MSHLDQSYRAISTEIRGLQQHFDDDHYLWRAGPGCERDVEVSSTFITVVMAYLCSLGRGAQRLIIDLKETKKRLARAEWYNEGWRRAVADRDHEINELKYRLRLEEDESWWLDHNYNAAREQVRKLKKKVHELREKNRRLRGNEILPAYDGYTGARRLVRLIGDGRRG